jgi:hypothetical protein
MALSDEHKISLSFKKLISKEFTDDSRAFFEEVSTNTLDISSTEIYTENIPGDPSTIDAGVGRKLTDFIMTPDPSFTGGSGEGKVWFICSGSGFTPNGSTGFNRNLIQRNFIPPKYSDSTNPLGNAADDNGYSIVLKNQAGTVIAGSDEIDWYFDYKTGILSVQDPNTVRDDYFTITVYQYTGKTLNTSLAEVGGASGIFLQTGSYYNTTNNVGITGSFDVGGTGVNVDFTGATNGVSGSFSGSFNGSHTGTANFTSLGATTATLGTVTATGLTVNGNLVVDGTTTTINTTNLEVEDQFIFLNNSSSEAGGRDGGIVVEKTTNGQGTALFWDTSDAAWAIDVSSVGKAATSANPDVYVVGVAVGGANPPANPVLGNADSSEKSRRGQMFIDDAADIWIYS